MKVYQWLLIQAVLWLIYLAGIFGLVYLGIRVVKAALS